MEVEVYNRPELMSYADSKKEKRIFHNFQEDLPVYFEGYAWKIKSFSYPRNCLSLGSNYLSGKQINFGTFYVILKTRNKLLIVDVALVTPIKHLTFFESFKLFFLNRIKYQLKE